MGRKKRDPKTFELAKTILENYTPENVDDMQEVLKVIFGCLLEQILYNS